MLLMEIEQETAHETMQRYHDVAEGEGESIALK